MARNWKFLGCIVCYKVLVICCSGLVGVLSEDYNNALHSAFLFRVDLPWPRGQEVLFESKFATWDAGPYLAIARDGYVRGSPLCAYYPLWPSIIAPVMALFGERAAFYWAVGLGHALSIVAIWATWKYFQRIVPRKVANLAIVLFLSFPGAIFFSFPYTESTFLLLAALSLLLLRRNSIKAFCLSSFLIPLARPVGILIVVPTAIFLIRSKAPIRKWLLLAPPLLGYGAYFVMMYFFTNDAFEGFKAQQYFANKASIAKIFDVPGFSAALIKIGGLFGHDDGLLDRLLLVVFLVFLPFCYRLDRVGFGFVLAIGIIPALSNQLMSYTRYIIVCFPWFVGLAHCLNRYDRRLVNLIVAGLIALQVACLLRHMAFKWVG